MEFMGVREFANNVSAVLERIEKSGEIIIITKHGRPIALLNAVDQQALFEHIIEHNTPELARRVVAPPPELEFAESEQT